VTVVLSVLAALLVLTPHGCPLMRHF